MDFIVKHNNVKALFEKLKSNNLKALKSGMVQGMRRYERHIIVNMLSGRKQPNYGLNVRTGQLRRSWRMYTQQMTNDVVVGLATSAIYARIHQYGGTVQNPGGQPYFIGKDGKAVFVSKDILGPNTHFKLTKPHPIKIPKRLYIYEEFKTVGLQMIAEGMLDSVRRSELIK